MRFIDCRIADADYERIREAARQIGLTTSEWMRQRLQEAASREPAWRYSTPVIPSTRVVDVKRNKRRGDARHHLGQRGTAHPSSHRGGHRRFGTQWRCGHGIGAAHGTESVRDVAQNTEETRSMKIKALLSRSSGLQGYAWLWSRRRRGLGSRSRASFRGWAHRRQRWRRLPVP